MVRAALTMFSALTALFTGSSCTATAQDLDAARQRMVDTQLRAEGISSGAVLAAMARGCRGTCSCRPELRERAYDNTPLPIGLGQTISQPFIVAYMTEMLQLTRDHTVLEIGTGSGYQAAVLAELAREVLSDRDCPAAGRPRARHAEGSRVLEHHRPHRERDTRLARACTIPPRIIVTAAPDAIPKTLIDQLAVGGIMVVPVGTLFQEIVVVTKTADGVAEKRTIPVRFVPMVQKPG